jgi:hypothetical protein
VRKILFIFSLWLALVSLTRADTFTLTDGGEVTGDIVKFDDNGALIRGAGDVYTNVAWANFSQASLKQFAQNQKIQPLVEPFITPEISARPPKPEIKITPVNRLQRPANPSLLGGMFSSPLGIFILLAIYLANLYAAFEISLVRARPIAAVVGLSVILPIIGPIIFLSLPMQDAPAEEPLIGADDPTQPAFANAASATPTPLAADDIQIMDASWNEEKKPEPQIFARGKFTFNKRFIETKFAGFAGAADGNDAKNFTMEVKTTREQFTVERIMQVEAAEVIFETVQRGQITVPLADIQEIQLVPKVT